MARDSMAKSERDWEAENACDTLMKAEEIRGNQSMMKRIMPMMEKRKMAMEQAMGKMENASPGLKTRMKRRNMVK